MAEPNRKRSSGMGQDSKKGNRRGLRDGSCVNITAQGACKGIGPRQGRQSNMPPAESAVGVENTFRNFDLHSLRRQAERMKKALENIQEQIRSLTER